MDLVQLSRSQVEKLIEIAQKSGSLIQVYYKSDKTSYTLKDDKSEVTQADLEANEYIISELAVHFPSIAVVSEENSEEDNLKAAAHDLYFMIDPLDGTSGFIKKSDEFTVNIALIKNGSPIFGVIYLPAKQITYYTDSEFKAWKIEDGEVQEICVSNESEKDLTIICTKREPEKSDITAWLKQSHIKVDNLISVGSSYKFCLIADGSADLYPRKVSIRAWDIAAGDAIVRAAGGKMCDYEGNELIYKFTRSFVVPLFVAAGFDFINAGNDVNKNVKSQNIQYVSGKISYDQRIKRNGHKGGIIWLSGLSGSGKTTLSQELQKYLFDKGMQTYILDGDNIRFGLSSDLGFSAEDRSENLRRVAEVAKLFADNGVIVITAFIAPYVKDHDVARHIAGDFFHSVYVKASLQTCEARDVKGLYAKARRGTIKNFIGIDSIYEEPNNPDLIIDTEKMSLEESVAILIDYVEQKCLF